MGIIKTGCGVCCFIIMPALFAIAYMFFYPVFQYEERNPQVVCDYNVHMDGLVPKISISDRDADGNWSTGMTELFAPDAFCNYIQFRGKQHTHYQMTGRLPKSRYTSFNIYDVGRKKTGLPALHFLDNQIELNDDGTFTLDLVPSKPGDTSGFKNLGPNVFHTEDSKWFMISRVYMGQGKNIPAVYRESFKTWDDGLPVISTPTEPEAIDRPGSCRPLTIFGTGAVRAACLLIQIFGCWTWPETPVQNDAILPLPTVDNTRGRWIRTIGDFMVPGGDHQFVFSYHKLRSDAVMVLKLPIPDINRIGRMEHSLAWYWSFNLYTPDSIVWDAFNELMAKITGENTVYAVIAPHLATPEVKAKVERKATELGWNYLPNTIPYGYRSVYPVLRQIVPSDDNPYSPLLCTKIRPIYGNCGDPEEQDIRHCMENAPESNYYLVDDFLRFEGF